MLQQLSDGRVRGLVIGDLTRAARRFRLLLLGGTLLGLAGCSWFVDPPKQRVVVRTTPQVPYYETETLATAGCVGDQVVWGNSATLAYHLKGAPAYGKTSYGAYMCRRTATLGGYHQAAGAER